MLVTVGVTDSEMLQMKSYASLSTTCEQLDDNTFHVTKKSEK